MDAALDDPGPGVLTDAHTGEGADLVRVEATVPLGIDASFALLADGIGGWWPAALSCAPTGASASMALDPVVGGRWGERSDGGDLAWGTVTLWDPPDHVRLTWAVDSDRRLPADVRDAPASRVDIRLAEVDDDLTTVIVEHRGLEAHDDPAAVRAWVGGEDGWWSILRAYVAAARA